MIAQRWCMWALKWPTKEAITHRLSGLVTCYLSWWWKGWSLDPQVATIYDIHSWLRSHISRSRICWRFNLDTCEDQNYAIFWINEFIIKRKRANKGPISSQIIIPNYKNCQRPGTCKGIKVMEFYIRLKKKKHYHQERLP